MIHTTRQLPEGYAPKFEINLQKDKKTAAKVNVSAGAAMSVLIILMHFIIPIQTLYDLSSGLKVYGLRFGGLLLGMIAYFILHELTHAAVMKIYGSKKVRFGFTGLYAYAGSTIDYFDKFSYLQTALAPLLVWGVIFTVILLLVPRTWFWVIYFLQVVNIAGSIGDVYVFLRLLKEPKTIYIRDTGTDMQIYDRKVDSNETNGEHI